MDLYQHYQKQDEIMTKMVAVLSILQSNNIFEKMQYITLLRFNHAVASN